MKTAPADRAPRPLRWVRAFERGLLTVLVAAMVALAALQVILRNVFERGWPWAEPLLGMGLLWITMLGALAATGSGRHIALDVASHSLPGGVRAVLARVLALFSAALCVLLTVASWRYVDFQRELLRGHLLGVAQWRWYLVLPAGFGLMALRYLGRVVFPQRWLPVRSEERA